jgi:hypothetical protein
MDSTIYFLSGVGMWGTVAPLLAHVLERAALGIGVPDFFDPPPEQLKTAGPKGGVHA